MSSNNSVKYLEKELEDITARIKKLELEKQEIEKILKNKKAADSSISSGRAAVFQPRESTTESKTTNKISLLNELSAKVMKRRLNQGIRVENIEHSENTNFARKQSATQKKNK